MTDSFGRTIDYLRLSVTDLCNYRCRYCMEAEGVPKLQRGEILSMEELAEIGAAAVACGVTKIRLTGGEPLVRPGIRTLCRLLRQEKGLRELTLTTNGSLLADCAADLREAGVDRLNVSLDTLREDRFAALTRRGSLREVLLGLEAAKRAGFTGTKLNTVLLGGFNLDEISDFVDLTREEPLCIRFIELMPMGPCAQWQKESFVPAESVLQAVPTLQPVGGSGVAELYQVPGYRGTVGLIRPMSRCFCGECRRIRVTADGRLKLCLHGAEEFPLRGLHGTALEQAIREAVLQKPARHHLAEGSRAGRTMNEIGG